MMDDKQLQIDVSRFPLKHETFERKQELGDKLVRLRTVSRHAEARRRNMAIGSVYDAGVNYRKRKYCHFALRVGGSSRARRQC